MTVKPESSSGPAPIPVVEKASPSVAGLFDFGSPSETRKRLFQFAKPSLAKRSRKTALGPTRSEFGCD